MTACSKQEYSLLQAPELTKRLLDAAPYSGPLSERVTLEEIRFRVAGDELLGADSSVIALVAVGAGRSALPRVYALVHCFPMSLSWAAPPLVPDASGVLRIAGTRVSLESLVALYQDGASPHELARAFPDLTLDVVKAALLYYREHRLEVEEYIEARRRAAELGEARIREDFPWAYRRLAPPSQGRGRA